MGELTQLLAVIVLSFLPHQWMEIKWRPPKFLFDRILLDYYHSLSSLTNYHMILQKIQSMRLTQSFVCATGIVSLLFTSCAGTQDGRTTQAQGAGIGALVGAGLGAVIGNQLGSAEQGALIGAAIGGAGGFAYGSHVANQKAKYKSTEEWLDACIASAEKKRSDAVAYNNKLDQRIAQLKREVNTAKASNDKNKLKDLKRQIAAEQSAANKQVQTMNKEIELQNGAVKSAGSSSRTSSLRSKISTLGSANASTQKKSQSLAALSNSTGV